MIPLYGCRQCLSVVMIRGSLTRHKELILDHEMFKDGWPCVRCSSKMYSLDQEDIVCTADIKFSVKYELTVDEFFMALCGFGLPDELGCEPEIVRAVLLSAKIIDVATNVSCSGRTVISKIALDNGLSLHLAGSPYGATVYKITRAHNDRVDSSGVQEGSKNGILRGYGDACSRGQCDQPFGDKAPDSVHLHPDGTGGDHAARGVEEASRSSRTNESGDK